MDSPQPNPSQPPVLGQKDLGHPSNGDVISVLETLPKDRPFGVVDDNLKLEFLRQLYMPLRRLFGTTTSRSKANIHRVQSINQLEVLQKLRDRFPQFKKDPFEFWERSVEALPQYSGQGKLDRARTFLEGAVQLDTNIDEQRILQRFVAVSAYKLFRRAIPTSESRVLVTSVKRFLVHTGLSVSNCDIETYSNIIRRGQRYTNFCRQLAAGHIGDGDLVNGEEHNEIYGTLFFLSIPDSIWDEKGLTGEDFDRTIEHLHTLDIMKKSEDSTATYMAKILLDFHASFVWISPLDPDQSSSGKRKHATKPRARYEDKRRKRNQGSCPSRPVSTCQASGINHTRVGLLQQEEQESGDSIQGAVSSQDPTQLNTLPLSTCSPNLSQARSVEKPTMNIIPSQPPGEETLLDIAALDYAGPQCSISDNGNDHSNALGFVAPLLNMSCLDFVDPQFSFYPPLYSFEQNVPPAQNQD